MTPFPNLSHRFIKCSALLLLSAVLAVLLLKAFADGTSYDSSTSGLLNEHYTVRTTISNGTSSRSYEVTYKFFVDGIPYSGQSWLTEEPIEASAIVYYMAANPNDNSLHPTKSDDWKLALALGFLLISAVAYYRLPKDEPVQTRSSQAGYGDSAGEDMRMVRGTYDAYIYVHAAFLIQVILVGTLLIGLATFTSLRPMSYEVLAVATAASIVTSLWIFFDRWDCCEAFASNLCSGWAILSVLYVPFVTVIYANFRGLGKLFGR